MHAVGELFNFTAHTFAPAVLVTPLGELSVLTGTALGTYFLKKRLNVVGFLAFCIFTAVYCLFMIYKVCPHYGNAKPLYYLSMGAETGAVSIMALKAFGIAVKLTIAGTNQFLHISNYMFGIFAAGSIIVQMKCFNKALSVYPQSIVSPVYYVTFTSAVLVASFILFQGFNVADNAKLIPLLDGFLVTFSGA
ncbi:uncharacterized protein JN550_001074 [Neoarthrinium moseri]|uniref:uncharacterized protein n=1 Tax=Neoarthrinium moseri TaxID=1658444 RepID=UPI001FDC640C|nr:uncharacterized protein JN550_001074 [Neoarthrinium moseri]KAI1877002.1 hypothetical protein JN550_001074 [Neoarthrinium moseri]